MLKQEDCPDYPLRSIRCVKSLESAFMQGQGVASWAAHWGFVTLTTYILSIQHQGCSILKVLHME